MTLPRTADSGCEGAVLVRAQRGRPLPPRLAGSMAAQPCSNQGTSTQQKTQEKGLLLKTAKNRTKARPVGAMARAWANRWGWSPSARGTSQPVALALRGAAAHTGLRGLLSGSDTCFTVQGGRCPVLQKSDRKHRPRRGTQC